MLVVVLHFIDYVQKKWSSNSLSSLSGNPIILAPSRFPLNWSEVHRHRSVETACDWQTLLTYLFLHSMRDPQQEGIALILPRHLFSLSLSVMYLPLSLRPAPIQVDQGFVICLIRFVSHYALSQAMCHLGTFGSLLPGFLSDWLAWLLAAWLAGTVGWRWNDYLLFPVARVKRIYDTKEQNKLRCTHRCPSTKTQIPQRHRLTHPQAHTCTARHTDNNTETHTHR